MEDQKKEMEKAEKGATSTSSELTRPNIPNKSSYNFKA